jgi:Uma2 family endonuclease
MRPLDASTASGSRLLEDVSWQEFEALAADDSSPTRGRIAYDQGRIEIVSPTRKHEKINRLLAWLVQVLCEELEIDLDSGGSTTFKARLLGKGIEPDSCFYVASEPLVRGKFDFDAEDVPRPDLAIEVEVSRKLLKRLPIYAALGVKEVWRHDGKTLSFHLLEARGTYRRSEHSSVFPRIQVSDLARFLDMCETTSETRIVRAFRAWEREHLKG